MKLRELFDNVNNPEIAIENYLLKVIDFENEFESVSKLNRVLKVSYIVNNFIAIVNDGGLESYFDGTAGIFRKELEKAVTLVNSKNALKLIKKANKIIDQIEERIGKSIKDNLESLTEEESDELNKIYESYLSLDDELLDDLRKYIIYNRNEEF